MSALYKRSFIFVTFLGCCLAVVLLSAAFGTKYWTVATAKNTHNPAKSNGKINVGLFEAEKSLNIGYGLRTYHVNVLELLQVEPDFLIYGLWFGTFASLSVSLLLSVICAIFAVINIATRPVGALTGIPGLYLWNTLAVLFEICAVSCWTFQFYHKLQYNMLSRDDRKLSWTSDGMAHLGHSFWFVIASAIIQIFNIIIISYGTANRTKHISPVIEEKGNGAIMLY